MYYAVLCKEIKMPCSGGELTLRVGGVYEICNHFSKANTVQYRLVDTLDWTEQYQAASSFGHWDEMPKSVATEHFSKCFRKLSDAVEASFMVCEEAYC